MPNRCNRENPKFGRYKIAKRQSAQKIWHFKIFNDIFRLEIIEIMKIKPVECGANRRRRHENLEFFRKCKIFDQDCIN